MKPTTAPLIGQMWLWAAASTLVVIVCIAAIVATHHRLSPTWDEGNHIAAGMELLQDGEYTLFTENPPVARVAVALGPYLAGSRLPAEGRSREDVETTWYLTWDLGDRILNEDGNQQRQIALARRGTLAFFALGALVLWFWLVPLGGATAFLAITLYCTQPAILAHSGLATTDIAFTAVFLLLAWRLIRWVETPSIAQSVLLGACLGLAVATKFTALVFVPPLAVAVVAARFRNGPDETTTAWTALRKRLEQLSMVVAPVAFVVLWSVYGFSVGPVTDLPSSVAGWHAYGDSVDGWRGSFVRSLGTRALPMPELVHGLLVLFSHNDAGHHAYALGHTSSHGFSYFYPLALAIKAPLPLLILFAGSLVGAAIRRPRLPWWSFAVFGTIPLVLLALLGSSVNIGSRHVLAISALAAVGIGASVPPLLQNVSARWRGRATAVVGALVVWQAVVAAASFPHFLSYFNPIAAHDPGAFLVDSDLDWGQGLFALEDFCAEHGIDSLFVALNGSANACEYDLPELHQLPPFTPVKGWIAISEVDYRGIYPFARADPPCGLQSGRLLEGELPFYGWLDAHEPVQVLADSIRIYQVR